MDIIWVWLCVCVSEKTARKNMQWSIIHSLVIWMWRPFEIMVVYLFWPAYDWNFHWNFSWFNYSKNALNLVCCWNMEILHISINFWQILFTLDILCCWYAVSSYPSTQGSQQHEMVIHAFSQATLNSYFCPGSQNNHQTFY